MKKTNKKGFTLVELVIVIAVIAILAAVLIPVFANLIEKADKSAAMQNAKNEYTAYAIAKAEDGFETDCLIKSGKYYFIVDNGQVNTDAKEEEPEGYNTTTDITAGLPDCSDSIEIYAKAANNG
ncbi:MAG: type II secretion system protein [Clostridia bacterium]|nr:type II secretion system protein [Clostridia bacterium]